jgi:two-component system LytT family response regulator
VIPADRLDAAEAQDDYVALKAEGRTYLKQQTLTSLAAALDPARFVRVHRSHLLRLDALARLEPLGTGSHIAVLADGTRIPISREGYARLKERLG